MIKFNTLEGSDLTGNQKNKLIRKVFGDKYTGTGNYKITENNGTVTVQVEVKTGAGSTEWFDVPNEEVAGAKLYNDLKQKYVAAKAKQLGFNDENCKCYENIDIYQDPKDNSICIIAKPASGVTTVPAYDIKMVPDKKLSTSKMTVYDVFMKDSDDVFKKCGQKTTVSEGELGNVYKILEDNKHTKMTFLEEGIYTFKHNDIIYLFVTDTRTGDVKTWHPVSEEFLKNQYSFDTEHQNIVDLY